MRGFRNTLTIRSAKLGPERLSMDNTEICATHKQRDETAPRREGAEIHEPRLASRTIAVNRLSSTKKFTKF
jgi:hypothetical protein